MSASEELDNLFQVKFGLDFGTFRSTMAYKTKDEAPKTPTYQNGCQGGVPSLFWRSPKGEEQVGDQVVATNGIVEDPEGVCASVKMKLAERSICLHDHPYRPSEVAIKLVKRILDVSRDALEQDFVDMEFDELVVGVPVRFIAAEKGEIHRIMYIATEGKRIRLVPEPILAALANDYYNLKTGRGPRTVLVYDMGAGTFDVALLQPNSNRTPANPYPYQVLCSDGMRQAGDILDEKMEQLLLDKIRACPGGVKVSVLEDVKHYDRRRLRLTAREVKERLSSAQEYSAIISGVDCGSGIVAVTRSEYEKRIQTVIQETVDMADEVLRRSGLGFQPDIDILLVGGSTYIPLIRELLEKKFPWLQPGQIMQRFPEKAVALGATIYAEEPELVPSKVPYGYAINTYYTSKKRSMLHVRIPSGAELPMTAQATYCTRNADQTGVQFAVYEVSTGKQDEYLEIGEGRVLDDEYYIEHSFGKAVPKGTVVQLTTTLTKDGLLTMTVDDLGVSGDVTSKTFTLTNTMVK